MHYTLFNGDLEFTKGQFDTQQQQWEGRHNKRGRDFNDKFVVGDRKQNEFAGEIDQ